MPDDNGFVTIRFTVPRTVSETRLFSLEIPNKEFEEMRGNDKKLVHYCCENFEDYAEDLGPAPDGFDDVEYDGDYDMAYLELYDEEEEEDDETEE
jgi:hypothetical protein